MNSDLSVQYPIFWCPSLPKFPYKAPVPYSAQFCELIGLLCASPSSQHHMLCCSATGPACLSVCLRSPDQMSPAYLNAGMHPGVPHCNSSLWEFTHLEHGIWPLTYLVVSCRGLPMRFDSLLCFAYTVMIQNKPQAHSLPTALSQQRNIMELH